MAGVFHTLQTSRDILLTTTKIKLNTDVKNAVVKLALVPPGLVMGQAYTFSIQAHVSPSLPSVLQLHVHAQNTTLCSSRVAGCRQKDLLVLGGGNATSVWGAVTVDFVSPVNSTCHGMVIPQYHVTQ